MGDEGIGFLASTPGIEAYVVDRDGTALYTPGSRGTWHDRVILEKGHDVSPRALLPGRAPRHRRALRPLGLDRRESARAGGDRGGPGRDTSPPTWPSRRFRALDRQRIGPHNGADTRPDNRAGLDPGRTGALRRDTDVRRIRDRREIPHRLQAAASLQSRRGGGIPDLPGLQGVRIVVGGAAGPPARRDSRRCHSRLEDQAIQARRLLPRGLRGDDPRKRPRPGDSRSIRRSGISAMSSSIPRRYSSLR